MARPSTFSLVTGAAVAAVFTALQLAPEPANARFVPRVDAAQASRLVADGSTPLVLAFGLTGCKVCHAAIKILRTIAEGAPPGVRFAEVELAEVPALAERFGVETAPTELVFVGGREVSRTAALETPAELRLALAHGPPGGPP